MDKHIKNIIETIKDLEWQIKKIYVENNCIYGEIVNKYGIEKKKDFMQQVKKIQRMFTMYIKN